MKRSLCFLFFALVTVVCHSQISANEVPPKKYKFSLCAIFKNEASYLKEWLEYHRMIGVDHFYLYTCGSTDDFMRILRPYLHKRLVTLVRWPEMCQENGDCTFRWALTTLTSAYENALAAYAVKETEWLAFLNVDEFLVPMQGTQIADVLQQYQEYPGIDLPIEWYEAYNVGRDPTRKLVIETVELTADPQENIERGVTKMIFKPGECQGFTWPPYRCVFKNDAETVSAAHSELRVNRYLRRFMGFLNFDKSGNKLHVDSRRLGEDEIRQLLDMGYEIEDQERAIYRFVPQLRTKIGN